MPIRLGRRKAGEAVLSGYCAAWDWRAKPNFVKMWRILAHLAILNYLEAHFGSLGAAAPFIHSS
jgi:hypothetical protein